MSKHIARVLRPKKFEDIIGQDTSVKMVQNAVINNNMRPVCIIFGPSGVGKTTLARIIALWQCCTGDRTNEPCGCCENCLAILSDTHPDVIELDGGTYTGVENIKAMLSTTQYTTASYNTNNQRVYILDEVHMLSRHAMTALLKEFEKELAGIQFILATTNIDKLPVAIVSRALPVRLDSVPSELIISNLNKVAFKSDYSIDPESLQMIAYASHGSIRQSLSLFEQVGLLNNEITSENTRKLLGLAGIDSVNRIIEAFEKQSLNLLMDEISKVQDVDSMTFITQVIASIQQRIQEKSASELLINIGRELAEAAVTIHNLPYSNNLIEITFGYALIKTKTNVVEPASNDGPKISDIARKLFK